MGGIRGRKPKPTAAKDLAGNPGHRSLNEGEPKPRASSARAPRGLGDEGGRFWRKYAPALTALGILTEIDEPALRMAAEHYEVAVRAAADLRLGQPVLDVNGAPVLDADGQPRREDPGLTVTDDDGNVRKHPLLQVFKDQSAALRSYLTEFGMTPSSRTRLHVQSEEQPSLADILFGEVGKVVVTEGVDVDV
jgi:P27 family predicted phage terminase small subunit